MNSKCEEAKLEWENALENIGVGKISDIIHEDESMDDFINGYYFVTGASRLTIIPPKGNYVFKIDRDQADYTYCSNEARAYEEAQKKDVAQAFNWCSYIDTISEIDKDVYAADRCKMIDFDEVASKVEDCFSEDEYGREFVELSDEEKEKINNEVYDDTTTTMEYYSELEWEDKFGRGIKDNIMAFIDEYNINDLHDENFGITTDGRLVVIDYAGYDREIGYEDDNE